MTSHTYRWDLDKTYLDTDFDSVRGMLRSALESAAEKHTVPGARALLRALSHREGARICVLSGSPTQLRDVLGQKLALDGIRYDELVLKDNLGNLRRGRLRAIRGQLGYKLPVLLASRRSTPTGTHETLFGDDAETDALVYCIYADALAGRLTPAGLERVLRAAGAYADDMETAIEALRGQPRADVVDRIFIHLESHGPSDRFAPLGGRVVPVHSWFQAAAVLYGDGHLTAADVVHVATEVVVDRELHPLLLANQLQDVVRRGHLEPEHLERFVGEGLDDPLHRKVAVLCRSRLGQLSGHRVTCPLLPPAPPDYAALWERFGRRA